MEQPEGMKEPGKESWVCYMHKTLYGLMQAACAWNLCLHRAMIDIGYVRITANHCIYMCKTAKGSSIMAICVDNMGAAASNMAEMAKLKEQLRKFFSLVDLGELKWLLGIAITRDRRARTISLCQGAYIKSIAKQLNLTDAHLVTMPLESRPTCHTVERSRSHKCRGTTMDEENPIPYRCRIDHVCHHCYMSRRRRFCCTTSQPVQQQSGKCSLDSCATYNTVPICY